MIYDIVKYLGMIVVGIFFSRFDIEKLNLDLSKIQRFCLLFLLFVLGISIGIDDKIMSNIHIMGVQAFVFGVLTLIGSVLIMILFRKLFKLDLEVGKDDI